MTRFELPSGDGFPTAEKIGKYLTEQLGSGYKFDHQDDELAQTFGGRRGALGRWLNESIFGDMTVVVSNNPLFGTAIRFYPQEGRTLLVVQGIVPNPTLRKVVLPCLGMAVMFGALVGLQNAIGIAIFFGWLPFYWLLPRLCALPLTGKVGRLLTDADACRAAGIDPPPVNASDLDNVSPEQATSFRTLGMARILLGLVIAGGATAYATTQLRRPYSAMLWDDTLRECSIAAGFGLMWVYVGISSWFLRRVSWFKSGLLLLVLSGFCAGAWAIVAPQICPPSHVPTAVPQAVPPVTKDGT